MFYLHKNNVLLLAKCQTFLFLILWVVLKNHDAAFAQEGYPQKLHFPQLRKPTPINHFHPKHKPVYQEIIRPSPHEDPRLEKVRYNEESILHGRLEYPKTVRPPAYDVILRKIDFDNERNQDITTISGIVENTMDYNSQEGIIQTVKTPSYTYVPSTENNWKGREESTTSYVVNEPVTNNREIDSMIKTSISNDHSNTYQTEVDDTRYLERKSAGSRNPYTGLHQKIPNYHTDTLHGHFKPKHPKQYHEIRRGNKDSDDNAADMSSIILATTMMPITNRPDTTFYATEGKRNTTIISIQELKNRFTNNMMITTAPWQDENDETENYLKYKNIQHQQHVVETDKNYDSTNNYGIQEITTKRSKKYGKESYANNRLVETQVRNPYKNSQGELIRSLPSLRAYGGARQRPTYESASPTITPPHYYEIDYDDRMSPQPRQFKYKWDQPSTEAIRSMNTRNPMYNQPASPPPRRHYQIQRTRHNHPQDNNAPIPYPPIPTYPSSAVGSTSRPPITADRRNEYVNIDRSTIEPYITSTYEKFSPEPTTLPKKVSSKGKPYLDDLSSFHNSNDINKNNRI